MYSQQSENDSFERAFVKLIILVFVTSLSNGTLFTWATMGSAIHHGIWWDVTKEVPDLARRLEASFHHVKRRTNSMADSLAKEEINHDSLRIN